MKKAEVYSLYSFAGVVCISVLALVFIYIEMMIRPEPSIDVSYVHKELLHRPVSDVSEIQPNDVKKYISSGSKFFVYREYIMKGDWRGCRHFTWLVSKDEEFIYKYPTLDVIGLKKPAKLSFRTELPNPFPHGKYSLHTRVICEIAPVRRPWTFDFPVTEFEVKTIR